MNTAAKLSTGGKLSTAPFSASKKSGMKRENPPCTPYKRKARGKENNPGALSTGLSAGAYAGACERIRAREARRSADATPHGRKSSRSAKRRRSRRSSARHPTFCRSSGSSSKTAQTGRNQYAKSWQNRGHGKNNLPSRQEPLFSASKRTLASLQNRVFVSVKHRNPSPRRVEGVRLK